MKTEAEEIQIIIDRALVLEEVVVDDLVAEEEDKTTH